MPEQINAVWKPVTVGDLEARINELNELVDLLRSQMRDQNMRTRDRFAMAALTGLIAYPGTVKTGDITKRAYEYADAMMELRAALPVK